MTQKEFNQKIAESPNLEFYKNFQLSFNYPHIGFKWEAKGVAEIYSFILEQIEGIEGRGELPTEISAIKIRFSDAKNAILSLFKSNDVNNQNWINNLEFLTRNNPPVYLNDSPELDFLIKLNKQNLAYYNSAYEYFRGYINNVSNKDYFIGALLAYEFTMKNSSGIVERREIEKKSIEETRSQFQSQLNEANAQLVEYIATIKNASDLNIKTIESFRKTKEDEYLTWFSKAVDEFVEFKANSMKTVISLEDLYQEKLKLEAPAQYWRSRAQVLKNEGKKWLFGLIACIVVGVVVLGVTLNEIAAGTLEKVFQNNGTAIKWSVVYIAMISFLAFAIRVFSKLTFSSFHLSRDAEEREQLAYVYLALKKEDSIDKTERHLIMQSLFSRADSGLLKDDAGPTMPGNIADKIIK